MKGLSRNRRKSIGSKKPHKEYESFDFRLAKLIFKKKPKKTDIDDAGESCLKK